jgi:hypothetical protein
LARVCVSGAGRMASTPVLKLLRRGGSSWSRKGEIGTERELDDFDVEGVVFPVVIKTWVPGGRAAVAGSLVM